MKRFAIVLAVLILSLYGCGNDSSTSPQAEDESPLAADTIGTDGGTLVGEDFEITIPAGAFESDTGLELYLSTEDHGFGDNCVSRFFRLEGLPESFQDTLIVRMGYEGALSGSTYVVLGDEATFYDDDFEACEDLSYSFHLATEAAGYLEAEIPPRAGMLRGGTVASSAREDAFAAITGIGVHKTSEHFTVRYPLGVFAYVDDVIDYLETAHDTVVSIGMGYKGMQWKWPGSLVIKDFGRPAPTLHHASSKGLKMLLKTSVLTEENLPDVRRWLGNLMVKSAQSIPDENEFTDDDNFGWNVAVLSFLQEEWSDPAGFIRPVTFGGNESFALRGLPLQASAAAAAQHGAGWSPVVKHLTGLYGMKLLGDIYQVTQTTDREPVGVLLEEIPDPAYNWWPQFVDKYVTGKYYGVEGSVLLLHITSADKYTIRTASDTLKVFSHDTPQVSARMHRVHLDYALVAEDAVMELSLSVPGVNEDYVTLLVYKSKDGVMELAGSGNPVTVSGLRDLTVAGYDIVPIEVISYNDEPYHEDVSTELRCRIAPPPSYNAAYINFTSINVHLEDSYGNDWWDANWYEMWEGVGEWNGNTFTASWANRPLPGIGTTSGDLTITIDPVTWDVVSFRAAQTKLSTTGFTFVDSIIGGNVPCVDKTASPASHKLCQLTGTDACSGMSVYAYRRINNENGAWIELDSFHCQATTYLNVTFWYEPGVLRLPGRR